MESLKTGLDLYAIDHQGSYACIGTCELEKQGGSNFWAYNYKWPGIDGKCNTDDDDQIIKSKGEIRFSNSASGGAFMEELANEGYISKGDWNDPVNPKIGDQNNCRYIVKESENVAGKIYNYVLHCNLEYYLDYESNDGGTNDTVYEIQKPNNWLCIDGTYD